MKKLLLLFLALPTVNSIFTMDDQFGRGARTYCLVRRKIQRAVTCGCYNPQTTPGSESVLAAQATLLVSLNPVFAYSLAKEVHMKQHMIYGMFCLVNCACDLFIAPWGHVIFNGRDPFGNIEPEKLLNEIPRQLTIEAGRTKQKRP